MLFVSKLTAKQGNKKCDVVFAHSSATLQILTVNIEKSFNFLLCFVQGCLRYLHPWTISIQNRNCFSHLLIWNTIQYLVVVFTWRILLNLYTPPFLFLFVTALIFFCLSFLGRSVIKAVLLTNNNRLPHWQTMIKKITWTTLLINRTYSPFVQSGFYFQILSSPSSHQTHTITDYSRQLWRRSDSLSISLLLQPTIPQMT